MRIVTVSCALPVIGAGAAGNWLPLLLQELVKAGHDVSHVLGRGKYSTRSIESDENHVAYAKIGVNIYPVDFVKDAKSHIGRSQSKLDSIKRLIGIYPAEPAHIWPREFATATIANDIIRSLRPDCVVCLALDGMLLAGDWHETPKIAIDAEGPHINIALRWKYTPKIRPTISWSFIKYTYSCWLEYTRLRDAYIKILKVQDRLLLQGPHYAEWATRQNINNAYYCATPIPDFAADDPFINTNNDDPMLRKSRIIVVGHFNSTSSQTSLPLLFDGVLPKLLEKLGADNFELHIIGRNETLPDIYAHWRNHPSVFFRGPITPLGPELINADVVLVTVPGRTGRRMRIVHSLSYGCCIIAHINNRFGLPELMHGESILFGKNSEELTLLIVKALRDPILRDKISHAARKIFEKSYTSKIRMPEIIEHIHQANLKATTT